MTAARRSVARVAAALALGACAPYRANPPRNDYAGAAVLGGSAVVAAGVNRALSGDCWATCAYGTRCDRARGVCVPLDCATRCPADLVCERVGGEEVCVSPHRRREAALDAGDDAAPDGASDAAAR